MPLFEFTCHKCGHQFEELLSLSELASDELKCPDCRSRRVERGFSAFATGTSSMAPGGAPGGGCGSGRGCGSGGFT